MTLTDLGSVDCERLTCLGCYFGDRLFHVVKSYSMLCFRFTSTRMRMKTWHLVCGLMLIYSFCFRGEGGESSGAVIGGTI